MSLRTLALLYLVFLEAGCAYQKVWHRFETPNVILKTNAEREVGERLIVDIERFRATLGMLSNLDFDARSSEKIRLGAVFVGTRRVSHRPRARRVLGNRGV